MVKREAAAAAVAATDDEQKTDKSDDIDQADGEAVRTNFISLYYAFFMHRLLTFI